MTTQKINILYTRKSDEDKDAQVQSISDQRREIERTIIQHNKDLEIDLELSEEKSAKTPFIRTEFAKLMQYVYSDKVKYVFCWKLNRLARNMIEGGQIIDALQTGKISAIYTPGKTYLPNENAILMAVEFGQSNQYSIDLSIDVKRGLKSKIEKGDKPGTPNIGYSDDRMGRKGEKRLLKDPEKFEKVKFLLKEALTGKYNYSSLFRLGKEIGLAPRKWRRGKGILSKSTLVGIIKNPVYAGKFWYDGILYKGRHEAMISWDEHLKLQTIFGRKNQPRPIKHENKYTGLFKCGECGYTIIPEPPKKKLIKSTGEIKFYKYWRCSHKSKDHNCSQKSIIEDDLTAQVNGYLKNIELDKEFIEWGMKYIEAYSQGQIQLRQTIEKEKKKQLDEVTYSLDSMTTTYFSSENVHKELLTDEEFKIQKVKRTEEKQRLLDEISNLSEKQNEFIKEIENDLQFCERVVEKFNNGSYDDKKQILMKLGRTMIIKDKKVNIESKISFIKFKEIKMQLVTNPSWLELNEPLQNKENKSVEMISAIWSG